MTPGQAKEEERKVLDFYSERWREYGYDTRSLGIGSRESQEVRFEVLSQIGDLRNAAILDVGCGFGDLRTFLERRGIPVRYTGLDIQPAFIEEARRRHPGDAFVCADVERYEPEAPPDYVFISGTFNVKFREDQEAWIFRILGRLFARCRRGVAINLLSTYYDPGHFRDDMFYCRPERAFELAHAVARWVTLRHDYLPHDFTLYLHRKG
ncbi:MAG: class I SAM-dependent methyltransferase [Anaerolineales bacterium]|nr:class I SAM-dependent methyltransferase [Anaerolineales bacterium]